MAKQVVNIGTAANTRNGDSLRDAFVKVNNNFTELYALSAADVQIPAQAGHGGKVLKTTGLSLLFEHVSYNELTDRPTLFSGSYNDLSNKPLLFSGNYNDLSNKPALFSGNYNDLLNRPSLFSGSYTDLTDKPTLFSGSYDDLSNKPNVIEISSLKTIVADSTDFADFQARIAAL